jgi:hypothetical protein
MAYGIRLRHGDVGGAWSSIVWGIKTRKEADRIAKQQHNSSFATVGIFNGNKKVKEIAPRVYEKEHAKLQKSQGEMTQIGENHYRLKVKNTTYDIKSTNDTGRGWTLYKGGKKIQYFPGHIPEARAKALELSRKK